MPVPSSQDQQQMYCSEQINIPLTFPSILKCYAKAAIRTQPYDLLLWSAAYFRALADGDLPPVKKRLEYPPYDHPTGITPNFLKILLNQFTRDEENGKTVVDRTATSMCVTLESLLARWRGIALSDSSLYQILMTGRLLELPGAPVVCDLYRFLAIACGLLGNNLFETMIHVCELLTQEPEGGSAMIARKTFINLYEYLADLDCSGGQSIIGTGATGVATTLERDEASLVRSFSPSYDSSLSADVSSDEKETRDVQCRNIDTSTDDTESELSICHAEVPRCEKYSEQLASHSEDETEIPRCNTRAFEKRAYAETSARRRGDCIGAKAADETEKPRNERNTNDDKKSTPERVPEGKAEEYSGDEVTRVQEARRRRRDVEMHSRMEEVKPVTGETTAKLLDSPCSRADSSSSLGESHVVSGEGVKACEGATNAPSKNTKPHQHPKNFEATDKILATRSLELCKQVEDDQHARKEIGIENASRRVNDSPTARSGNIKKIIKKNLGKSSTRKRIDETSKDADTGKTIRDSFEWDYPTDNGDKVTLNKKSSLRLRRDGKESSGQEELTEGAVNPEDYVSGESREENESEEEYEDVEDEEVEDMAKYEPIGLENVLEGICECLESTKDVRGVSSATDIPVEQLDPVAEFIERMKAESLTDPYVLPEVPGIGPPVSNERVTAVGVWLAECARRQQGYVGPRNLRHFLCPNLDEKPSRYKQYDAEENECVSDCVSDCRLTKNTH